MRNQKESIRKVVAFLNNKEEAGGGFWLPNIQREFVWSEDQICKLFDSIMREYPISTLLVWKTMNGIRRRKFIDNWHDSLRLSDFFIPEDSKKKCLVLDGQQRLQSLFIGLCGSYNGKELYFDVLSGQVARPDDIKFRFEFRENAVALFPWVKMKDLVFTAKRPRELRDEIGAASAVPLSSADVNRIADNIDVIDRTFKVNDTIAYQELDSIDNPSLYREDDVVEIFIRANSGGTKLEKSDLLFSLLNATWEHATDKMEALLESLNKTGFAFTRDFVLKTSLVLIGQGARYEVEKFRTEGVRENLEASWDAIAESIQVVLDFVRGKTFIQCDKALPSYLVLIPLIYLRHRHPEAWEKARDLDTYLLRCLFAKAFGGQPDGLLDALVKTIDEKGEFVLEEVFNVIRSQGRSLELTEDQFWRFGYGSDAIHLLFNIWYRSFNHTPSYINNHPQIDHIFPVSALKELKVRNPETGRMIMKYKDNQRNQLANCMLLTREENGAGGKWDTLPSIWFASKDSAYLEKHLIPDDPSLWQLENFDAFIEARQDLIKSKFKTLLV